MDESKTDETKAGTDQDVTEALLRRSPLHDYDPKKYKGKKLLIRFTHLEFPKAALQFTYRGVRYSLEDNKEISLPLEVIEHLNSLAIPEGKYEVDLITGQIHKTDTVLRHRFSCVPVNLHSILTKEEKQK